MRKLTITLTTCLLALMLGCNAPIEVSLPEEGSVPEGAVGERDFNVLIEPGPYRIDRDADGEAYSSFARVYLRPFAEPDPSTSYAMLFESTGYGYLDIAGQRIYPGDRLEVAYARFENHRLGMRYGSPTESAQQVTLTFTNGRNSRKARTTFDFKVK